MMGDPDPLPPDPPDGHGESTKMEVSQPLFAPSQITSTIESRKRRGDEFITHLSQISQKKNFSNDLSESVPSIQSVYIHPQLEIENRTYTSSDKGPFLIHVSRVESDPALGLSIRPIKFGKFLHFNKIKNIALDGIQSVGRNRISVKFISAEDANAFLKNEKLSVNNYKAVIPTYNITRMGMVRGVPVEWSMNEFVESIETPQNLLILKARRLSRKENVEGSDPKWIPTQSVVLTFKGQILPSHIYSFFNSLKVEPYQLPTIQCLKCCRFGHIQTLCRSIARCFRCAGAHTGDSCLVEKSQATCASCSASHFATDKNCPEHSRQRSIKIIIANENISYSEASLRFPSSRLAYSDVTRMNSQPQTPSLNTSSPVSIRESSLPNSPNNSLKKTVFLTRRPRPSLSQGYDKKAHQNIIRNPHVSSTNGCAISCSPETYSQSSNDNMMEVMLSLLLNMISKCNNSLPYHVAQKLRQLANYSVHNEPDDPSVERTQH